MSRSALLSLDEGADMVTVEFPYDRDFLDQFKRDIPYPGRQWDRGRKCWMVHVDLIDEVRAMLAKRFGPVAMNRHLEKRLQPSGEWCDTGPLDPDAYHKRWLW